MLHLYRVFFLFLFQCDVVTLVFHILFIFSSSFPSYHRVYSYSEVVSLALFFSHVSDRIFSPSYMLFHASFMCVWTLSRYCLVSVYQLGMSCILTNDDTIFQSLFSSPSSTTLSALFFMKNFTWTLFTLCRLHFALILTKTMRKVYDGIV